MFTSRYWKCLLSPLMLRGAALFSCIMSVLIIWSEVNLFLRFIFTNAFYYLLILSNIYFSGDVFLKKSNFECFCCFCQFIFKKQRLFCNWNYVYYYHILPKSLCLLHNFQDPSTELLLFGWKPSFRRVHSTFLRSITVQVRKTF